MPNRRDFLRGVAGAAGGALLLGKEGLLKDAYGMPLPQAASGAAATVPGKRREIKVGGKRVKTVDAHCHVNVPEVADMLKGTPLERAAGGGGAAGSAAGGGRGSPSG